MITPLVTIDGFPAPARWGDNAYAAPAGQRHVSVTSSYLWRFGQAELPVSIAAGQSVTVHYSCPMITFVGGRIGFEPQPRAGTVAFWILMAFLALILLGSVVAFIVGT